LERKYVKINKFNKNGQLKTFPTDMPKPLETLKNLKIEIFFFVFVWVILAVFGRSNFFLDPGTFSHLVVGERMVSSGRLIYQDPFSFTFFGHPWIAQQWLSECLMALLFRLGGFDSLLTITVTILACLYTWLLNRLINRGVHPLVSLIFVAFVLTASIFHFLARPHILTMFFLAVTLALLSDFEAGRVSLARLFWLIPLFIIWTNLHGGVLGGIATFVITGAGWLVLKALKKESPIKEGQRLTLIFLMIAACLTPLFNPYGMKLPATWFSIMGSSVIAEKIQEHQPLFSFDYWWLVLPCMVLYFFYFLGTLKSPLRPTWLIPILWFFLSLSRVRHTTLFAVSVAIAIGEMYPYTRWVQWFSRKGSTFFSLQGEEEPENRKPLYLLLLLPLFLMLTSFLFQRNGLTIPVIGKNWVKLDPNHWPLEILPELKAIGNSQGQGTPVFNDDLFGGFLIFFTPQLRVFVDDRFELYGEKFLRMVADGAANNPGQIEIWARQYGFSYALTMKGSGFDKYLSGATRWRLIKKDKAGRLYRKFTG
jgi:hypothetical protein